MAHGDSRSNVPSAQQTTQSETYRNMVGGGTRSTAYSNVCAIDDEEVEDLYNDSLGPPRRDNYGLNANYNDGDTECYGAQQIDEIGSNPMSHDSTFRRKRRRSKLFCIGVLLLSVGALVIGLTVTYTRKDDDKKVENDTNSAEQERGGATETNNNTSKIPTASPAPKTSDEFGWDNIVDTINGGDGDDSGTDKGEADPTSKKSPTAGAEKPVASPTIADTSISSTTAPTDADGAGKGNQGEVVNIFDETDPVSSAPTVLMPTVTGNSTGSPVSAVPSAAIPMNDEDQSLDELGGGGEERVNATDAPSLTGGGDGGGSGSGSPATRAPSAADIIPTALFPSAWPTPGQPSKTPNLMTPSSPSKTPESSAPTTSKPSLAPAMPVVTLPPASGGDGTTITAAPTARSSSGGDEKSAATGTAAPSMRPTVTPGSSS